MAQPKLSIRSLSKSFDTDRGPLETVKEVDLEVGRDEFVVLLGPSGCGKSTLLRIVAGLERPTRGEVLLDGQAIKGPGRERGMVFQSYTSFEWRTVRENVEVALLPLGLPKAQVTRIAQRYVDLVGLSQFENFWPKQLSGGMLQRVAIARALAAQPEVLLFDEPFGALDAQTRSQMQEELQKFLQKADERTVLFVTHDVEEAMFLADRIIVFSSRPATIREEVQITGRELAGEMIPPTCFRDASFKASPAFVELRMQLETLIKQEQGAGRLWQS